MTEDIKNQTTQNESRKKRRELLQSMAFLGGCGLLTSGVMSVQARVSRETGGWKVEQAAYQRTARRLAEGTAFIRRSTIPDVSTG